MKKIQNRDFLIELVLPLTILLLLTVFFRLTDIDLQVSRHFYTAERGWAFKEFWLWSFLYTYGIYPGISIGYVGLIGLLLGYKFPKIRRQWRSYLLLLLLLAIGPGLLVNAIFKDNWGRTRPRQVVELGGHLPFIKVWDRGERGVGRSFPSGHASIGFFLISPYFVLRRRRARIAKGFFIGGTLYGLLMGTGRIVQGGHFLSDVMWSWGMVYLSGLLLYYLLKPENIPEPMRELN